MSEDADRFRRRAAQCRRLAENARDEADRKQLREMADELAAEADKIDADDAEVNDA